MRDVVEIKKCPICSNHLGFRATVDSIQITPDPTRPPDKGAWNHMRVDEFGVTCSSCNEIILLGVQIPCYMPVAV